MLEILGFIALIAIIFGVSMTTAVGIIIKAVLWLIGICIAINLISKMNAKTIATIALIAGVFGIALLIGIDKYSTNVNAPCFAIGASDVRAYGACLENAHQNVEARFQASLWMVAIGIFVGIPALVKSNKDKKKTNSAPTNSRNTVRK